MAFDALAMHAVRDELEDTLRDGHVEKLFLLSPLELGIRVRSHYRDHNLMISADPQAARVHLVHGTLRRLTDDVSPFLLLLRKHVRDGRIVAVEQPELERVIELKVEKRQEDGSTTASSLIIEVMGRHSNVILVGGDGEVLDAMKRIPPSLSRQRPVLPHLQYSPPPAVDKLSPLSPVLAAQLTTAAQRSTSEAPLWRFLQESVSAMGPLTAREATYRCCGDAAATLSVVDSWETVAERISDLFSPVRTREWSPCVVVEDGAVVHFAPYLLTQFHENQVEKVDSISVAVERAFAERIRTRPNEALRGPLRASIRARLERVIRREESLRQGLLRGEKAEPLKAAGQAILASTGAIAPGQNELLWEGEKIALDPTLSAAENAQRYFKNYAKARDATREIPALLESVEQERAYLEEMLLHVEQAESEPELRALSRELSEPSPGKRDETAGARSGGKAGRGRGSGKGKGSEPPQGTVRKVESSEGIPILIGGSARGNERATFDLGTGGDLWLHARKIPGAHVIVKLGGREVPRQTLAEAARLAAWHSQARGSSKVPVDYTLQRYVKKIKGGPPGLVTYSQEKTVRADATEPEKSG